MRARSARYTIRSTKYIHNLIAVNPADYINKHTTTLYLSFLSISTHTHTHTHTHFLFTLCVYRGAVSTSSKLLSSEPSSVCSQTFTKAMACSTVIIGLTRVTTGVVLRHELPPLGWLTVVKTGYQKKKHRQCQNAAVCSQ